MKNKSGFYVRSMACNDAINEGKESISFRCPESEARCTGVEWHHGGSGIIAFFPSNEEQRERVMNLRDELSKRVIKSKKAAIAYLEQTTGDYKIPYKVGKYGKFFSFWGKPDGELSIDKDDVNLPTIRALLNI